MTKRQPYEPRPCEGCGATIDSALRSTRRYCSDACYQRVYSKRKAATRPPDPRLAPKACEGCGTRFTPKVFWQRFCELGCQDRTSQKRRGSPARNKANRLRSKYGMTLAEFDALIARQEGRCAICSTENPRAVDHDHLTSRVRGILCSPCNTGIGHMRDDPARLRAAADYLEAQC